MISTVLILVISILSICFVTVPVFAKDMGFYSNKLYDFSFNAPTDWKYSEDYLWFGTNYQVILFPNPFNLTRDSMEIPRTYVKFEI